MISPNATIKSIFQESNGKNTFEIHEFLTHHDEGKKDSINTMIKQESLWFVGANPRDARKQIITKEASEVASCTFKNKESEDKQYLIRENKLLRIPNDEECKKISSGLGNDGSFNPRLGEEIRHNSYGRMFMANARASSTSVGHKRIGYLSRAYNKIFSFNGPVGKRIKIESYGNGQIVKPDWVYEVTCNERASNMPLKKVFEVLKIYNSTFGCNDDKTKTDGSVPLLVTLNIGGLPCSFMLSKWHLEGAEFQVLVSMETKEFDEEGRQIFKGSTYKGFMKKINELYRLGGNWSQRSLAEVISSFLDEPMCMNEEQRNKPKTHIDWKRYTEETSGLQNSVVELLATTQIAEAHYGRVPGMNKLARHAFRKISKDEAYWDFNFEKIFTENSSLPNKYPPVGSGGTDSARTAVQEIKKVGLECWDMSDDSDEEEKFSYRDRGRGIPLDITM